MRLRSRRRRWLGVALPAIALAGVLMVTSGTAFGLDRHREVAEARGQGAGVNLVKLRQQASTARQQLKQATKKYEHSKKRLQQARDRLERTRGQLRQTRKRLKGMEKPIGAIANAAYQHSPVNGFSNVFTSRHPQSTMRAAVDFAKLTHEQQAALRKMERLVNRKRRLVASAENLAERARNRSGRLQKQEKHLKAKSEQQTEQLVHGLRSIGLHVSRNDRLPIGCHPDAVDLSGYPNGLIPEAALCPLPQDGEHLRADAAVAFAKLNVAYAKHFGESICVTDSYRSLSVQQKLYSRKPGLAAVPGTSNHGLGLAVDLCGGLNAYGTQQFLWMKKHARQYGWVHPDWAAAWGSRPEPWHWEYYKADH